MVSTDEIQDVLLHGGDVVGADGKRIGRVGQVFLDERTGRPEWVTTTTGHFGSAESFVPLADATVAGREVRVPYDKDTIKAAPRIDDADGRLSPAEEAELYRHYGLRDPIEAQAPGTATAPPVVATDTRATTSDEPATPDAGTTTGTGTAPPAPADDDAMTLSAERVDVTTEKAPAERVRLRKHEVTEDETVTVPVRREEYYLEEVGTDGTVTDSQRQDHLTTSEELDGTDRQEPGHGSDPATRDRGPSH